MSKLLICPFVVKHLYPGYDVYVHTTELYNLEYIFNALNKEHKIYKIEKIHNAESKLLTELDQNSSLESILYYGFNKIYPNSTFIRELFEKALDEVELSHKLDPAYALKDYLLSISICDNQKNFITSWLKHVEDNYIY